jgi:hypothetical protein
MMGTLRATIRATRCATHLVADNSSLSGRGFCAPALSLLALIHEMRGTGILGSSLHASNALAPAKIVHLDDTLAALGEYAAFVT